jgi:hypothetical protein
MASVHQLGGRGVEDLVLADLDDALDAATGRALREHIGSCMTCARIAYEQRRIASALATPPNSGETERARLANLDRIRSRRTKAPVARFVASLSVGLGLLLITVVATVLISEGAADPTIPVREQLVERADHVGNAAVTLVVEDGRAVARPGASTSVVVRADVRFAEPPTRGFLEVRIRREGEEFYGIVARAPSLVGASRSTIEGQLPAADRGPSAVYLVWLHVEYDAGDYDTAPITIEVYAVAGGERGRAR